MLNPTRLRFYMPVRAWLRCLALGLPLAACGGSDGASVGSEQGACYPNSTCNAGLVCASDLCVDLSESGTDAAGPSGAGDGEDAEDEDGPQGDNGPCLDELVNCDSMNDPALDTCGGPYIDCRVSEGVAECTAAGELCQVTGEPECVDLWGWCFDGDTDDADDDANNDDANNDDSGGQTDGTDTNGGDGDDSDSNGASCISEGQCAAACANRVWICDNCDVEAYCPSALDSETCLWECEVAFDSDNDTVFELDSCALELGHTCSEDALIDCFYATHC